MSTKRIDEASITAMVTGFLTNQKQNAIKKDALNRKSKAFWKVVSESVSLLEAAPKDWDREREPDDWRQKMDAPTKESGKRNISIEDGAFSSKDDPEKEVERTPREDKDSGEGEVVRTKNRASASPQEIAKKVHSRLALMKKRQPELYEKEFGSKTPEEQKKYKIKLALKLRSDDGLKVEKGGGDTRKGGAAAAAKRQEVVSGLVNRIFEKVSDFSVDPSKIDTGLSTFAHRFLGINLKDPSFAVSVLEKYKNANPEQKKQISDAIASKTLDNPKTALNLIKFMNSRLDMFPHDWMDQTEEFANKQGVPSTPEDKEQGVGLGIKKIDDLDYFLKKKGGDENWLDQTVAKLEDKIKKTEAALANLPMQSPNQNKYLAVIKKTKEQLQQVLNAKEDLKGKVVGRKHVGDSAVHRLFKTSPIEDITRYADYFTQNPEEIERSKEERKVPPPSELDDIMGKLHGIGDEKELQKSEIGGEDDVAHMASSVDIGAAKKDYKSKMDKFKAGQQNIKSASAEHGDRPSKFVHPAAPQYEKPFDLDYKEIFKNMTDVGTFDAPKKKIPGLTMKVVNDLANRFNLRARKQYGEDRTSPEQIIDVLKKLGQYDAKNRYKGLADTLDALAPEEQWVGKELQRVFNPKRMSAKQPKEDEVSLPKAFSDYASSELEKVVANVPAREEAIKGEKERQAGEEAAKQERLAKFKASAPTPEEGEELDRQRIATRQNLSSKLKSRAQDLEKERESEKDILNTKFGDKEEFERLGRDKAFLDRDVVEDPLRYRRPSGATPEPTSDDELKQKLEKAIERLKASNPGQYRTFAQMSPEKQEAFRAKKLEELRKKTDAKKLEKSNREAEVKSPYETLSVTRKLHDLKTKERSPEFLKGRQMRLSRALERGKAKDPIAAQTQLSKIADVLPHAARARELQGLDASRTFVPPALGPTSRPSKPGISFEKPRPAGPKPLQLHGGTVGGSRPPTKTGFEKDRSADTAGTSTSYPEKIMRIRNKGAESTLSDEEKKAQLDAIGQEEFPSFSGHSVGDTTFKYNQEDQGTFKKRLITNLVKDAKKKLAKAGSSPQDVDLLKRYISLNFSKKKYPASYDAVKDLFDPDREVQKKKLPVVKDEPKETKNEGKNMKSKKLSLMELLVSIDSDKLGHADAKEEAWENGKPEKKMKFEPKFEKQKKMGK